MKAFIMLFLFSLSLTMYGQDYFINAENGLNVRSQGDLSSKKIAKLRFGALVHKVAETDKTFIINDNGKQIKGKFVKIKFYNSYLSTDDVEGFVFDGYLKKRTNDEVLTITEIKVSDYIKLSEQSLDLCEKPMKITGFDSIKTHLKDRVTWNNNETLKSITLQNKEEVLFNENAVDFRFSEGHSGYYPEQEILVLEGGHGTDVCFSIRTGETELTIGNPEYIIQSPYNNYRLNGYFGGQECISYFFQKKEKETYKFLTELDWKFDVCTFLEFHWINENQFIYIIPNYSNDAEIGEKEYFLGQINDNVLSNINEEKKPFNNVKFYNIINEIQFKERPILDTTNFDNTNDVDYFNLISVKNLQLVKIYPHFYSEGHNYKASASYRIDLSNDFHTVVFIIHKGDNEMESVLINYDLNGFIIDSKVIAYDEIAEGWSRIESNIDNNIISVKNIKWIDEKEETIKEYVITEIGNIKLKDN